MQTTARHSDTNDRQLAAEFDRFFARLGQGINAYLERLSRVEEVNRLNAMSDAQLRKIGLRREDIVRHVFRDKFHA